MSTKDEFRINIRVADIPQFSLTIKREEEEVYRKAVTDINKLWEYWKRNSNNDSDRILAVIALIFAKQVYVATEARDAEKESNTEQIDAVTSLLSNFENELDKIIIKISSK